MNFVFPYDGILLPYDSAEGEILQHKKSLENLKSEFNSSLKTPFNFAWHETDHGIGASWGTITLEVIGLASIFNKLFFGIPEGRKKIKDALAGWKEIKSDLDRVLGYISARTRIIVYPKEYALLKVFEILKERRPIDTNELELVSFTKIDGSNDRSSLAPQIDPIYYTGLFYYQFAFKYRSVAIIVLVDSRCNLVDYKELLLDYRLYFGNLGNDTNIKANIDRAFVD